jgi:O-acetyl-ADP-ribose deacetylase (regulator of RNase III)
MGKLVIFRLAGADFQEGFPVTLQICEDHPENITHPFTTITGKLPPAPLINRHYQQWQENYRNLGKQVRLGSPPTQVTRISQSCQDDADNLRKTLGRWYHCENESFAKVREKLLTELDKQESIRLLIQTENRQLRFLPWHLFFDSFLQQYPLAEIALSPENYGTIKLPLNPHDHIRILAVFGSNEGLNLNPDKDALLAVNNAHTETLISPNREKLFNYLYEQNWHILFFAGHSFSAGETWQGKLQINAHDLISISQLNHALRKAIARGLRLAIFNSCDGLGLAQDLEALHLPQIMVMREMIPDRVAHLFISEFLKGFSQGNSLYLATRQAREKLQPLEKEYPCATWLPIICQNPATLPLTWRNLQGLAFNLPPPNLSKTPDNLATTVLTKTIKNTVLRVEYSDLTQIKAEVLVSCDDTYLSMSDGVSAALLAKGGKVIKKEVQRRIPKQLGQVAITTAGNLDADYIFHTVLLDYEQPDLTNIALIQQVTRRCLDLAAAQGLKTIAFPALATGMANFAPESSAIAMIVEIVNYLENYDHFEEVKIVLHRHRDRTIQDETVTRFYQQLSQFLELNHEFKIRSSLLAQLKEIYQHRHLELACQIIDRYQQQLSQLQQEWLSKFLPENSPSEFNPTSEYQQSLAEISEQVSEMEVGGDRTDGTIIPQSFHELAAQIWHELEAVSSPEEMFSLLAPLQDDIDGLAWLNDQYELAIASHQAKLKKISQILQSQIDELEQGKKVLSQQLLWWHQQGILRTKAQGKERNVTFKSYPKLNLKVKPEELPPDYRSEKISYSADKKALKEANNNGLDISKWADIDANLKVKFGFR